MMVDIENAGLISISDKNGFDWMFNDTSTQR